MRHKRIITLILSFFLMTSVLCTGVLADEEPKMPGFHTYYNETFENSGMRFFATDEDGDGLTWTQVSDGKAYEGLKYVTTPTSKDAGFSDKTENRLTTNDFVPAKGDFAEFYISAKNPESVGDKLYVYLYDTLTQQYTSLGVYSTLSYWERHTVDLSSGAYRSTRLVFAQKADKDNPGINLDNFRIWRQDRYDTISRVEPTCTTNGHKEYYQTRDKEYYFEDKDFKVLIPDLDAWLKDDGLLPATGHTMTHYDGIEPTYDSAGRKEYYECEVCGEKFADAEGLVPLTDTSIPYLENALIDPNQKVIYNPNYESSYEIGFKTHDEKYVDGVTGFAKECYTVSYPFNDLTKKYISFKSECLAALGTGTHEATVQFNRGNDVDIEIVVPEYVELKFVFPGYDTFPGSMKVTADSQEDEYFTRTNVYVPKNDTVNLEFFSDMLKLVDYTVDGVALADEFVASEDMTITVNTREYISSLSMKPSAYDYGQKTVGYKAVSPYEFVLENDGETGLAFLLPELKSYEIIDVEIINNPEAEEGPMYLGAYEEEYNFVYLDKLDKAVLKVKPKDGLAVGKYNEELRIDAYWFSNEAMTLDNEQEIPEANVSVKADLSFEVLKKELDNVPATNDTSAIALYGVVGISGLGLALCLMADRKRRSLK